jgi:hypothetical protein
MARHLEYYVPIFWRGEFPMIKRMLMLVLGLSVMSPAAFAACVQADGAGTWRVFVHANDSAWLSCNFAVNEAGTINSATSSCKENSGASAKPTGSLKFQSSCRITGTFKPGGFTFQIVEGQLSRDKITAAGVGTYGSIGKFAFTAIKK